MFFVTGDDSDILYGVGETKLEAVQHAMNRFRLSVDAFYDLMEHWHVVLPSQNITLYLTEEN